MYERLADIYDELYNEPYWLWFDFIREEFEKRGINSGSIILDLACGTGTLALKFANAGYEVIGVDSSPNMLSLAKQKAPNILFLLQKMELLDLYGDVKGAYCTFNALNYCLSPLELKNVFERVALFLAKNGVFIFDINTPRFYENYAKTGKERQKFDFISAAKKIKLKFFNKFEPKTNIHVYEIKIDDYTEKHIQRAYSVQEVKEALLKSGFKNIKINADYKRGQTPNEESQVIVYSAAF